MNSSLIPNSLHLTVRKILPGSRAALYRAWTEPRELRKWFGVADGFTTPIAEVDLRVGGRYRLGMQAPGAAEIQTAGGVYREIIPQEKLVFTWRWENSPPEEPETLVTLEFIERGSVTELVLTHQGLASESQRQLHLDGWEGCIAQLERMLSPKI